MVSTDDVIMTAVGAGLLGMLAASPTVEDQNLLKSAKEAQRVFNARQQRLGTFPHLVQLANDPDAHRAFSEACNLYLYGFFRQAAGTASAVIEHLLKKKYGDEKFVALIENAGKEGILTQNDIHCLQLIRLDRNDYVHNIHQPIVENDALITIHLAARLAGKLVQ